MTKNINTKRYWIVWIGLHLVTFFTVLPMGFLFLYSYRGDRVPMPVLIGAVFSWVLYPHVAEFSYLFRQDMKEYKDAIEKDKA